MPTTPGGDAYDYPRGADDLVFSARGYQVGGDGTVYRPTELTGSGTDSTSGDSSDGFRHPAVVPMPPRRAHRLDVAHIDDEGMQRLYAAADEAGLLDHHVRPPDDFNWYPDQERISVDIVVDDRPLHHLAPSRAEGQDVSDDVEQVASFVEGLTTIETYVGSEHVSDWEPFVPERWLLEDGYYDYMVRQWPLDADPEMGTCVVLPSDKDVDTAAGLYTVESGGSPFAASPALPWTECA